MPLLLLLLLLISYILPRNNFLPQHNYDILAYANLSPLREFFDRLFYQLWIDTDPITITDVVVLKELVLIIENRLLKEISIKSG